MTQARSSLISIDATSYYHCVSRCVRRSFLCGYDSDSQQSYEHRRGWIEKRLLALPGAFCIDVCAYAIMSNHYHVVLHINVDRAKSLSEPDILHRLGFESSEWLEAYTRVEKGSLVGTELSMRAALSSLGRKRLCGYRIVCN